MNGRDNVDSRQLFNKDGVKHGRNRTALSPGTESLLFTFI